MADPVRPAVRNAGFGLAVMVAALVAATLAGLALEPLAGVQAPMLVYLVAILAVASSIGLRAGVSAALAAFLAYNFFFIEPRHTLVVGSGADLAALIGFLAAAAIAGSLAGRLRDAADRAARRAHLLETLTDFAGRALAARSSADVAGSLVAAAARIVNGAAAVVVDGGDGVTVAAASPAATLAAADLQSARRAIDRGVSQPAPADGGDGGFEARPLVLEPEARMALLLAHDGGGRAAAADVEQALATLLDQARLAAERLVHAEASARVAAEIEQERLRSALLSSISHDLRTPLAAILGAVTSLRELGPALGPAARADLLVAIEEETRRLSRFVDHLLDMTRLQSGLVIHAEDVDASELLRVVAEAARRRHPERRFDTEIAAGLPTVATDPAFAGQVLANLVDNAVKFSATDTKVTLSATAADGDLALAVTDHGPGVAAADQDRIFDAFFSFEPGRGRSAGTGLGLAICRGIATALGGTVGVLSPVEGGRGARFTLRLPIGREAA